MSTQIRDLYKGVTAATVAAANALIAGERQKMIITVTADENNGGATTRYTYEGSGGLVADFQLYSSTFFDIVGGQLVPKDGSITNSKLASDINFGSLSPTSVKTSNYTAVANDFVPVDTTSGNITITLPPNQPDKTRVAVKMIAVGGAFTTTIAAGGSAVFNKAGGATTASLSLLNQAVTFQYESATGIWSALSSDVPLSQLDLRFAGNIYVNVLLNGVLQNGSNQATNINALIGSNKTIYFPYGTNGTYNLTAPIAISGVSNLKIFADKGVVLTSTASKVFDISGTVTNLEIAGFKLVSTRNSTTELDDGVINITNFGAGTANITGLNIHDNEITAPNSFQNGIKLIAENAGVMSQIKVKNNYVHDVMRIGLEFQNTISNTIFKYMDYEISGNIIQDVSTSQTGTYNGVGISVAGGGKNGIISNNYVFDVHSTSGGKSAIGIEVAGNTDVIVDRNIVASKTYGFTGIVYTMATTQTRFNTRITNNIIDLAGTESGNLIIQGIQTFYAKGLDITNNTITTPGFGIYMYQSSNNNVSGNNIYCKAASAIHLNAASANNNFNNNLLDNTLAVSNDGLIVYEGVGSTGNVSKNSTFRMQGGAGGYISETSGASGNRVSEYAPVRTVTVDGGDILPTDEFLLVNTANGNIYFPSPGNYYGAIEQGVYIKNISSGTLTVNNNIAAGQKTVLQSQEGLLFKNNGTSYYAITQLTALTPRIQTVVSAATVTPDASNDAVKVTAQAAALTLANPTGTFSPMQAMIIRVKDNGTARAITYGTQYRAVGVTLPTTTVISKTLYLGMIWNNDDTKWDVTGYSIES